MKQAVLSKTCRICKEHLTIEHFSRSRSAKGGFDSVCIKCRLFIQKKGTKKYWREHPPNTVLDSIRKHNKQQEEKIDKEKETQRLNGVCYDQFMSNITKRKRKSGSQKNTPSKQICPVCREDKVQSLHHIIPRKYKGSDDKTNKIWLCNQCHDMIEAQTEQWIDSGKMYDSTILRSIVVNNGFEPIT